MYLPSVVLWKFMRVWRARNSRSVLSGAAARTGDLKEKENGNIKIREVQHA